MGENVGGNNRPCWTIACRYSLWQGLNNLLLSLLRFLKFWAEIEECDIEHYDDDDDDDDEFLSSGNLR